MSYLDAGADISECGTYRYRLWRHWGTPFEKATMVVVGLNPSTADAEKDDPTIRRCVSFAKREGCGRLVMVNLFALRSTDPSALLRHDDPEGPRNLRTLDDWLCPPFVCVAAWGAHPLAQEKGVLLAMRVPLLAFGFTKGLAPRHPLYLPLDAPLVPYRRAALRPAPDTETEP